MAYMQVEMFSQALHMADWNPEKKRIRNIRHCGCFMEQPMTRQRGSGGHPSNDMWHLLDWQL